MSLLFDDEYWQSIRDALGLQANLANAAKVFKMQPSWADILKTQFSIADVIKQHFNMNDTIREYFKSISNPFVFTDEHVQAYLRNLQVDLEHDPDEHEVIEHPETELTVPETRERIVIYSPSIALLEKLRARQISLFDLHWRQFEELVAELLTQDGYTVELGRGTKDGGKDIVAVKNFPGVGLIISVWQAKKLSPKNKVDISIIRELADTRLQQNATKGVIVTTTSLTRDALERVQRDSYYLHKVDGVDLDAWIQRGHQPLS